MAQKVSEESWYRDGRRFEYNGLEERTGTGIAFIRAAAFASPAAVAQSHEGMQLQEGIGCGWHLAAPRWNVNGRSPCLTWHLSGGWQKPLCLRGGPRKILLKMPCLRNCAQATTLPQASPPVCLVAMLRNQIHARLGLCVATAPLAVFGDGRPALACASRQAQRARGWLWHAAARGPQPRKRRSPCLAQAIRLRVFMVTSCQLFLAFLRRAGVCPMLFWNCARRAEVNQRAHIMALSLRHQPLPGCFL